jgi:hypothetical protein
MGAGISLPVFGYSQIPSLFDVGSGPNRHDWQKPRTLPKEYEPTKKIVSRIWVSPESSAAQG